MQPLLGMTLPVAATGSALEGAQAMVRHLVAPSGEGLISLALIGGALAAGIAAAYGREIQAGRRPDRTWWLARLLLLPLLGIGATAASQALGLSRSTTAFTTAMFSLGGYDCLRMIEAHWRSRLGAFANKARPSDVAPPNSGPSDGELER